MSVPTLSHIGMIFVHDWVNYHTYKISLHSQYCFHLSMVLTLCARSKEPDAAIRASNILKNMEEMHSQGRNEVIANSRCYSAVITAWARSGSPDAVKHALDLLDRMEQNRQVNSPHGAPNAHVYNSCIHAIAKSSESEKVKYCRDILHRMNRAKDAGDLDSAPTVITYSTIVNGMRRTHHLNFALVHQLISSQFFLLSFL